ncbi:hypothetical protein [Negadavirga shengliensis]|uniref:Uncharacterized protein n=1 Tax=Negadavirga shengliensis TaxID=1389218 RepID=A0ABV9T4Q4_9BACT
MIKNHKVSFCILLTATISPGDFDFVAVRSSQEREIQYLESVKFYKRFNLPIVFIDNSNFISKSIANELNENEGHEYLTFESQESIKGKGHGEIEIITYAISKSKVIKEKEFFIKISGRYIIENFKNVPPSNWTNSEVVICNLTRRFSWADTRIMFVSKHFYFNYLLPTAEIMLNEKQGVYLEKVYAMSVHFFLSKGGRFSFWRSYPYYSGVNGTNGKIIKFSPQKRIKYSMFLRMKKWIHNQTI